MQICSSNPSSVHRPTLPHLNAIEEASKRPSFTAQKKVSPLPVDYGTRESNWNVSDDGLRHIPSYYPLEKSSRFVSDAKPSEIANRISDCCRVMSVQATFDNKLVSPSSVCFVLTLLLGFWFSTQYHSFDQPIIIA